MVRRGSVSAEVRKTRLIMGSGQPYVQYLALEMTGVLRQVGIEQLTRGELDEIECVPPDADLLKLSNSKYPVYLGGQLYLAHEVADIDDPEAPDNLLEHFRSTNTVALIRIRHGPFYACLDRGVMHIPVSQGGHLLFDQCTVL
jgi:hypothetical protein